MREWHSHILTQIVRCGWGGSKKVNTGRRSCLLDVAVQRNISLQFNMVTLLLPLPKPHFACYATSKKVNHTQLQELFKLKLAKYCLSVGWIKVTSESKRKQTASKFDWNYFLLWSTPKCNYCIHTCQNESCHEVQESKKVPRLKKNADVKTGFLLTYDDPVARGRRGLSPAYVLLNRVSFVSLLFACMWAYVHVFITALWDIWTSTLLSQAVLIWRKAYYG